MKLLEKFGKIDDNHPIYAAIAIGVWVGLVALLVLG